MTFLWAWNQKKRLEIKYTEAIRVAVENAHEEAAEETKAKIYEDWFPWMYRDDLQGVEHILPEEWELHVRVIRQEGTGKIIVVTPTYGPNKQSLAHFTTRPSFRQIGNAGGFVPMPPKSLIEERARAHSEEDFMPLESSCVLAEDPATGFRRRMNRLRVVKE